MSLRVWLQVGLLAFLGGSLLRLGAETGQAAFTMFGMIAFLLIGLRVLGEVSIQQVRSGRARLERVLRRAARRWPAFHLPGARGQGIHYLARAGSRWVVLAVEPSSDAALWVLAKPALERRARRLARAVEGLSGDLATDEVVPVLVLVRRRVRPREEALGERLGVRLLNPEGLPAFLDRLAGEEVTLEPEEILSRSPAPSEPIPGAAGLAHRLGAESLLPGRSS